MNHTLRSTEPASIANTLRLLMAFCLSLILAACGGSDDDGGTNQPSNTPPTMAISPGIADLAAGASQVFTVRVDNAGSQAVAIDWSLQEGAEAGTLAGPTTNPDGTFSVTYTAPRRENASVAHLVAALRGNDSVKATATINVAAEPKPVPTITLTPATASVTTGATTVLTATLKDAPSGAAIDWSIQEGAAGGTLSAPTVNADGSVQVTYTAPASAAGTYHVVAALRGNDAVKATGTITVTAPAVSNNVYVTSRTGGTVTVCALNGTTGAVGNCGTPMSAFAEPLDITLDAANAYIVNIANNSVTRCAVDAATGALSSCANAGVPNLNQPTDVAIANGRAYILNFGDQTVQRCSVDGASGALSNCADAGAAGLVGPVGIDIRGNTAYIVSTTDRSLSVCSIDAATGNLNCPSNRHYVNLNLFSPYGVATTAKFVYVINRGAAANGTTAMVQSTVTRCERDEATGNIVAGSCAVESGVTVPGTAATDWLQFHRIAIRNNVAYITARNINKLVQCAIDATSGALSNCTTATADLPNATGVAIK